MAVNICFLVLLAIVVNSVHCGPFEVSVTTSDRYELGQDIICKVSIINTHEKDYRLFTRNTPLEGIKSGIFVVTQDEKTLRYDAMMFKRGPVEKNSDSIVIHGKKSISVDVDLSLAYAMTKAGTYSVMLNTKFFYLNEKGNISRQHLQSTAPAKLDLIMTGKLPKLTIAEKLRQEQVASKKIEGQLIAPQIGAKDPDYDGDGDSIDKDTAKTAWQDAYQWIVKSPASAAKLDSHFSKWFGTPTIGAEDTVIGIYQEIQKSMENTQYTLYFKGPMCERNDFAYTAYESTIIYLCPAYIRAKDLHDYGSKMGTLIHQLTHCVGDTNDYEYGIEECQNLAEDVQLEAIENADNYEYFCEEMTFESV